MKPTVLFVMDGLKIGGVETALIPVLRQLVSAGFAPDLLLLHEHDDLLNQVPKEIRILRYEQMENPPRPLPFYFWYAIMRLSRLLSIKKADLFCRQKVAASLNQAKIRKNLVKYDVVIGYKHGEAEAFVADYITAPKKIAFYHHGSVLDDGLHRRTFGNLDVVVGVSQGVCELLKAHYPEYAEKIRCIPNYIDPNGILKKARAYTAEREGVLTLCTVCRLAPEKRLDLLLEAAEQLKSKTPFRWLLIGDGELRDEIEANIKRMGLSQEVFCLGGLNNPLPYVAACDLYVQTSQVESFGLSMLEALVLGKPVVSTKTIGSKLLIEDGKNGILTAMSPDAVAEGIMLAQKLSIDTSSIIQKYRQEDERNDALWYGLLTGRL